MAVSDNYLPTKTVGNGSTVLFTASWNVIAAGFERIFLENVSTGIQVLQVKDTDYTLTFTSSTITVDFTIDAAPPPSTEFVIISRNVALTQTDPFKTSQGFEGAVIENNLDKITSMNQDIQDEVTRSLKYPVASGKAGTIPDPVDDAVLVFNGTSGALKVGATNTSLTAGAAAADASATAAATSETNAANSETNAATSETNAAASASGVNLPGITITDTGAILQVNAAGTAYELLAAGPSGEFLKSNGPDAALSYAANSFGWTTQRIVTLSSDASVEFEDGVSGVDTTIVGEYRLVIQNVTVSDDGRNINMEASVDGGSTKITGRYHHVLTNENGTYAESVNSSATLLLLVSGIGDATGEHGSCIVALGNLNATTHKTFKSLGTCVNVSNDLQLADSSIFAPTASAIDSITISTNATSMVAGKLIFQVREF